MSKIDNVNSLDDLNNFITAIQPLDTSILTKVIRRENQLTKPRGSLGRLEEITQKLALAQQKYPPCCDKQVEVLVFAGSHGITEQKVSAFPSEVNAQMLANFENGGAAINQLCKVSGARLRVIDCGIDQPTSDFSTTPAMSDYEMLSAFKLGYNAVDKNMNLIAIGEMGIGNTCSASAIYNALYQGNAKDWVGSGTGLNAEVQKHKTNVVESSVMLHKARLKSPLAILKCLGGREIAAMGGAVISARKHNIPVIVDGFVVTAMIALLHEINKVSIEHTIFGHLSKETAHIKALKKIGARALLNLDMCLGEASGAALAINIVKSAIACHNDMASFEEASVSSKNLPA